MSQITRCPSCGTKFKVVADQLRISDGWVRCGQCQEVFDAAAALLPPASAVASDTAGDAVQDAGYELPAAAETVDEQELFAATEPARVDPEAEQAEFDIAPESAPEAVSQAESETEKQQLPLDAVPPAAEPSFVRTARSKAFWQRPGVRAVLGLGCAGLLLGLLTQVALQQRNVLAAWQPSLRPALQSLCEWSGCSLAARQDIAQLVIVSSGFTRTADADRYLLSLTVENQASTELAMPAVELTLTDLQDRPVLRRVLLPEQIHAPSALAAGAQWSGSIPLAIDVADTRIAGYRALVFYP